MLDIINTETEKRLGEGQLDLRGGSKNCFFVEWLNISHWGGGEKVDVFPEFRIRIGQAYLKKFEGLLSCYYAREIGSGYGLIYLLKLP